MEAGRRLRARMQARIDAVRTATADAEPVRVAAIEWLDPPYCAGHWLPEMIAAAGGIDALARPGQRSRTLGWDEIAAARPEAVVVHALRVLREGAEAEARRHPAPSRRSARGRSTRSTRPRPSRGPGPRLADGVELLGHLLHPDLVAAPAGLEARLIRA